MLEPSSQSDGARKPANYTCPSKILPVQWRSDPHSDFQGDFQGDLSLDEAENVLTNDTTTRGTPFSKRVSDRANSILGKDTDQQNSGQKRSAKRRRRLPENFLLKRLDILYWKRLARYLYIRFLRIRSSPGAIARGMAVGMFAGSFPFLGLQSIIGITLAACVRGNKVVAAASTWISNPLTFVPLFALNFHVGRWLLRLPTTTTLPPAPIDLAEWMTVGMDVASAMLVGSFVVGIVFSVVGYYVGLMVAQRVRRARLARKRQK
ncbi:MAG: DUF2062 domain-containing protein [Cyanobacteria bacterium J06634_5]